MQLRHLSIVNYKNIEQAELDFSPSVNCFIGANGMGKTNLLDAVFYLSFCKSASNPLENSNIRHDADFFMIQGEYVSDEVADGRELVCCSVKRGGRKLVKRNGKDYRRFSEHVGKIPLVLIAPSDSFLVSGGSDERRKFMDVVISQYDSLYLEHVIRYEKTLKQRNALLKSEAEPDASVMDVLEDMMSESAAVVYDRRKAFVEAFVPIFRDIYARLCNSDTETVDIVYESHGARGALKDLLAAGRPKERIVGHTLHGVHKDELQLYFNGYPVKREGSQGQTKTYFIAMKLAQYVFLQRKGERKTPILLLDDIFDKLDAGRVAKIIEYVLEENFGQIFITDTNREHLDNILAGTKRDYRLFRVDKGIVASGKDGTQEI